MPILYFCIIMLGSGIPDQRIELRPADTLTTQNWTIEDGLPVNTTNFIIQDKKGYIWFTTYDGIVRFDGVHFKVFNHANTPEMPHNRTIELFLQDSVGVWASLEYGGILLINDDGFKFFGKNEGFTNSEVNFISKDRQGQIWFATSGGLYKSDKKGQITSVLIRNTSSQNKMNYVYQDYDDTYWVGTDDGIVHLAGEQTSVFNIDSGTLKNKITTIYRDKAGALIIGTALGIYVLKEGKFSVPSIYKSIKDEFIFRIYEDDEVCIISTSAGIYKRGKSLKKYKGNYPAHYETYTQFYRDSEGLLWMINVRGYVAWMHGDEIEIASEKNKLPPYYFNSIYEDREHNIWLTTARNGIVRVKRTQIKVIGTHEGLSGNNILALFEDSKGRLWVGTRDEGLNMIENNTITYFLENESLSGNIIQSVNEDKTGNIWVGNYNGGIDRVDTETKTFKNFRFGNENGINDIRSIFIANDSTIWLGTYAGLIRFDPDSLHHTFYNTSNGLAGNNVRYITQDSSGGLWIATMDGGISNFKDNTFKNYTVSDGLSSNNIRSIYIDESDTETIWIGTENNGLNRFRNGEIKTINKNEGLPDHIIHYISEDKYGWLWMSSNRGVFKIYKNDLNAYLDGHKKSFRMFTYGREEGMRNPECNGSFQQGGLKTSQGTFWFSTQEGVVIFNITDRILNTIPPTVIINEIEAKGKSYYENALKLSGADNDFSIYYSALTFVIPQKTKFKYRLEGYDEDWIEVTNQRVAVYNNVPFGKYTFHIIAANNDGVWSDDDIAIKVTIAPLIYETWWFYVLLCIILVVLFYLLSQLRYRVLLNRQHRLQEIIDAQTFQIRSEKNEIQKRNLIIEKQAQELESSNNAKDLYFSILAHDLRNPLQSMFGFSNLLASNFENMSKDDRQSSLREIKNATSNIVSLVENLLSWASLQAGKITPEIELIKIKDIIDKNIQLVHQSASQKNIQIETEIEDDIELLTDRNMINTIIRNLLSNAIKFTPVDGSVTIHVFSENNWCKISISDTGIGMSLELAEELTHSGTYTSRRGTANEKGTGIGFTICNEMASLLNGRIEIDSQEGRGTTFIISFPCTAEPPENNSIEK